MVLDRKDYPARLLSRAIQALSSGDPVAIEEVRAELAAAADEPGEGQLIAITRALLEVPDEPSR